jgi:phage terminase Nu1 subunit (DNA packaging protein)
MYEHPVDGQMYLESLEVADMAGVSLARVWQWASRGVLPAYQRGGVSKKYYFRQTDVEAFLEMKRVPVEPKKAARMTKREAAMSSRLAAAKVEAWATSRG